MTLSHAYNDCHGKMSAVHSPDKEQEWAHMNLHQEDWIAAKKGAIGKKILMPKPDNIY